jgi:hypothetical protein
MIANIAVAIVATLAPIAHVLELPNKLRLSGPLRLAVQKSLYQGWGPFLGGPFEIAGASDCACPLCPHTTAAADALRDCDRLLCRDAWRVSPRKRSGQQSSFDVDTQYGQH